MILMLLGVFSAQSFAVISLGWWEEDDPGTTHQFWDFLPDEVSAGGGVYNCSADPTETNNLASMHPEIVRDLSSKYDAWIEENKKWN